MSSSSSGITADTKGSGKSKATVISDGQVRGVMLLGGGGVSCPAYFSHTEGKNSLVNGLLRFRSVRFKNW